MKILATDFDDTLFFLDDKEKTKANVESAKKFMSKGNVFCIITGRTYLEIKDDLLNIGLPYTYLVCGDGALIFDSTDYCLKTVKLEKEIVEKAMKILVDNGYNPYMEDGYNITTNPDDCIKISSLYATNKEDGIIIAKQIAKELGVYTYASRRHVNVNNPMNDKRQAVLRLAEVAKLNPQDFHVIGDNVNDYEMLESFDAALVERHHPMLDELNLPVYSTFADYVTHLLET